MTEAPLLQMDRVSRTLAGRAVVSDLNLKLQRGDLLGLLGVNGAGKSTTLRLIAGALAPSSGTIRIDGHDLTADPAVGRRRIGYLPERAPLYAELSVLEYLAFCARLRGMPGKAAAVIDGVIQRCDLGDVRRRLIGQLSKGYQQRVGIAQAVLHEPDLVVLDEPASGLDPVQALKIRALIKELAVDHAVILSTHQLPDVLSSCNRVAILHLGRLRHEGAIGATADASAWRVVLSNVVDAAKWNKLAEVETATALSEHTWRLGLATGTQPEQLTAAIVRMGWGLQELRAEGGDLETTFLRIASADDTAEAA